MPVYLHDWFGPGRHAKIVSTKTRELKEDGLEYRSEPLLTGDESRVTEVRDVAFPKLLDPVDDLPPATVITHIRQLKGKWIIRGTCTDNGTIRKVLVNGQEARGVRGNFAEWEIELDERLAGDLKVDARAEDDSRNIEQMPHVVLLGEPQPPQ